MADSTGDEKIIQQDASSSSSQPSTECESSSANGTAPLTANTSNTSGISTDDAKPQGAAPLGTGETAAALDGGKAPTGPNVRFDGLDKAPDEDDDDVDNLSDPDEPPLAPNSFSSSYSRRDYLRSSYSDPYTNPYETPLPPKSLQERTIKAPKQVKQIVQYTKLMEDRVQALESEVRLLKGSRPAEPVADPLFGAPTNTDRPDYPPYDYPKPAEDPLSNPLIVNPTRAKKPPVSLEKYKYIPGIHRISESEYRAAYLGEDEQKYVIDVMIQEQAARPPSQATVVASAKTDESLETDPAGIKGRSGSIIEASTTQTSTVPKSLLKPKRIRINSKRLLDELCAVTDQVKDPNLSQFLAPFHPFTMYEQKIRNHTQALEAQCRGEVKKDTNPEEKPETGKQGKEIDSNVENENGTLKADAGNEPGNEDEDLDEIDSSGIEIPGHDILDVMEACQIGRKEAVKALKEHSLSSYAITAVLGKMTPEEKLKVDIGVAKLILAEWRALIAFLDEDLKSTLETCSQIRSGTLKAIAYDDLSHLYKPGDIVISTQNRRLQAYTVIATSGGRELLTDSIITGGPPMPGEPPKETLPIRTIQRYSPFIVDCWYYDFAGIGLECISKSITIPKYDDLKAVTALTLYPEALHDGHSRDLMAGLKTRGQKFIQLCLEADLGHRQYLGRTFDETPEEVDSQVIIDCHMAATVQPEHRPDLSEWVPVGGAMIPTEPDEREIIEYDTAKDKTKAYCSLGPSCTICNPAAVSTRIFNDQKLNRQKSQEYLSSWKYLDRTIPVEEFEEAGLALLPPRVFGFILRSRKWARLDIDKITDITTEGNGFKKLVLPEGYAELVQALVETHFKDPPPETEKTKLRHDVDLVRGKGKGLIILLHGAPGVGKTSTAESVAEFTKRPLYPITCGDIGETAREVETNLDRCFRQAHRWGCVLLLDEADVFLAKRDKSDLKRNALVSVFLRVLEYYAGILFLTTNRVGAFDDAFKSRIHMSLYYPDLDRESTMQVWEMNLDRTQENMKEIAVDRPKIMEFAKKQYKKAEKEGKGLWNGRQIRNAFQTAIALAEWLAKKEGPDPETKEARAAKLTANSFKKVAKASAEFDDYLERAHGAGEAQRAYLSKERVAEERSVEREVKRSKPKARSSSHKQKKSKNEDEDEKKSSKSKTKKRHDSSSEEEESDAKTSSEED